LEFLHALAQIVTVPGRHPEAPHRGGGLPSRKPGLVITDEGNRSRTRDLPIS
jgi:hypothetical protein